MTVKPRGPSSLARYPKYATTGIGAGDAGGMNGRQLAEEAMRRRPGLRALFTTRLDPGLQMIGKPFTRD